MKKLFAAVGIALLAFSCSSDDVSEFPAQGLSQYAVDFTAEKEEFYNQGGYSGANLYPMHEAQKHYLTGLAGVWVFYSGSNTVAFDRFCPVEWADVNGTGGALNKYGVDGIECKKCKSMFNYWTAEPVKGKAKDLGLKLVKYKVDYDTETGDCHITNPNYKK